MPSRSRRGDIDTRYISNALELSVLTGTDTSLSPGLQVMVVAFL